jgi:hypothetical protein
MNVIPNGKDFMEVLEEITVKRVNELDDEEIAFMKARRYYLTPGQLDKFASVLESPSPEAPKPRTAKKTKAKLD